MPTRSFYHTGMITLQEPAARRIVVSRRAKALHALLVASSLVFATALTLGKACAGGLRAAEAADVAGDYTKAANLYLDLAVHGNAVAQAQLGYMYAHGRGVPQNHYVAALWYRCAAGHGYPPAAYALGLQYDKGQGVPQDYVLAYTWLDLAVANSSRHRYYSRWVNIRNAISSKMTLNERLKAQELALMGPTPHVCEPLGMGG